MSKRQLDATGDRDTLILGGGFAGLLVVGVGGIWTCLHLSAWLFDQPAPRKDPLRLVVDLIAGRVQWTTGATVAAAVLAVLLLALVVTAVILWPGGKKMRPDRSTRYMARSEDLRHLSAAGSAAKGATFGTQSAGLPIGNTVRGGRGLFSSWEDMLILVAGPGRSRPPPTRSPAFSPPRVRAWRPRTSVTWSTAPPPCGLRSERSGCSTRRTWPTRLRLRGSRPGGGTR